MTFPRLSIGLIGWAGEQKNQSISDIRDCLAIQNIPSGRQLVEESQLGTIQSNFGSVDSQNRWKNVMTNQKWSK